MNFVLNNYCKQLSNYNRKIKFEFWFCLSVKATIQLFLESYEFTCSTAFDMHHYAFDLK